MKTFKAKYEGTSAKSGTTIKVGDDIIRNPKGKGYILATEFESIADTKGPKECKITPANRGFEDIEVEGYIVRAYRIVAKWGHTRAAFIRRPDGSYLTYEELRQWRLAHFNEEKGYIRSNIGSKFEDVWTG